MPSVILTNLVLGENVVPEFLQRDCTREKSGRRPCAAAGDSPERRRQIEAFARLDTIMEIGTRPRRRAAEIVLDAASHIRRAKIIRRQRGPPIQRRRIERSVARRYFRREIGR